MSDEKHAGVFRRFLSYILDSSVFMVFGVAITYLPFIETELEFFVYNFLFCLIYFSYFFGEGSTPGMRFFGLKLVRTNGDSPTYFTGVVRGLGLFLSTFIFFLGFIWILFDENNQGLHDKIARTYVV